MVVRGHTLCISRRKDAIPHVCVDLREVASIDASENPAAYLIKLRMKHSSFKHSDEVLRTESQSDFERWKRLLSVGRDAAGVGQPTPRPFSLDLCFFLSGQQFVRGKQYGKATGNESKELLTNKDF